MTWGLPEPGTYVKALVYGPPGVGKTTSLLTAPQPIRIIDSENSTLALVGLTDNIDLKIKRPKTFMDLQVALQELKDEEVKDGTIVFDTLTQLQRRHIRELSGNTIPGRREYYTDTYQLGRMYTAFTSIPCHILYFFGQDTHTVGEGDNKLVVLEPDTTPALLKDLLQISDAVGYMYLDVQGNRCICFEPSRQWYAKRRNYKIPKEVIYGTQLNKVVGGKLIDWTAIFKAAGGG